MNEPVNSSTTVMLFDLNETSNISCL